MEDRESKKVKTSPPKIPGTNKTSQMNKEKTIVLRLQSSISGEGIEQLEEEYSKKFGHKVVILKSSLQMVEVIDG